MPTIAPRVLTDFAVALLRAGGLPPGEAQVVGVSLVGANLRGHDSHGVMRIPFYLDGLKKGEVVSSAEFTVLRETPAMLAADGHWGFGQVQARRLMERIIAKARGEARLLGEAGLPSGGGVCVGTLVRCSHI